MSKTFVHTHVHSEYSILDGAARIKDMAATIKRDGQPALAITDHGNMYGALDFYKTMTANDITPLLGLEAYMAPESRFEKCTQKEITHLILLALNNEGYHNLIQLSSLASLEGQHYKPRCDWDLLEQFHDGLVATSGCLGGRVLQAFLNEDRETAYKDAARLQDIFGKENFFIELQDHNMPEQRQTNPQLIELAKFLDAPLLASNDTHYVEHKDHIPHDALLCVQTGSKIAQEERFKFSSDQHFLKTAVEMRELFKDYPEACDNTLLIAERSELKLSFGDLHLPQFPIPEGFADPAAYLMHLVAEGAKQRYGGSIPPEVKTRLRQEYDVITTMGFSSYFLIVWDLIRYAREKGIRVGPGRGSAAGSLISYCLRITDLDPLKHDLLFERFLNAGRNKELPDIDIDFDERYRDVMIQYTLEKYGRDRVAQIITFSTIGGRAGIRDATRVLDHPYALGDQIAKAMPKPVFGRNTPLSACMKLDKEHAEGYRAAGEIRSLYSSNPDAKEIIDIAVGLEGLRRQTSIHAAAVVISDAPLTEYLPIQKDTQSDEAAYITQYEMNEVAKLGLLKMDFLGLRNLSVIERTLDLIQQAGMAPVDIDNVPLDDEATFALLQKSDTVGVFQLEGSQMRALMRSLIPTTFDDIAALVALYRPGPMAANMHNEYADRKNGRKPVTYLHSDAKEILESTQGLMIYQEGLLRIAQKFAGFTLVEADVLRKACGKKIRELIAPEREKFIKGCERTGYGAELGKQWFDIIEPFADYAFGKAHAYAYGFIAYQTAYLKANYPIEYMSALLTSVSDDNKKLPVYLAECHRMKIPVLLPDVNLSNQDFTPEGQAIRYGLAAVRNVGAGAVEKLIAAREEGPFDDFLNFCRRVPNAVLNKKVLESLIKAGAFDSFGSRKGLYEGMELITGPVIKERKDWDSGKMSLFSVVPSMDCISPEEWEKRERLGYEKEMLTQYISENPLADMREVLEKHSDHTIDDLEVDFFDRTVGLAGVITTLVRKTTKAGKRMATFTLEDLTGAIPVLVFPKSYEKYGSLLEEGGIVAMRGKYVDEDDPRIFLSSIKSLDSK